MHLTLNPFNPCSAEILGTKPHVPESQQNPEGTSHTVGDTNPALPIIRNVP